ncbi:BTAD domain-containing putative transcriptional regulator [Amycolatopsis japonica]|uniref:AfsR/SARP family transcriptional regulator n=1 Tax=Amycolatopsis japonica TaxID=208439 RepID=UPI00332D8B99
MEINLLGPLEILRDGVVLTPSAPKLRTVFSLLVVQANSVVRTDQIIDELWEDNPPASVTTTLQTYIYQLRKLLQLAVPPDARPAGDIGGPEAAAALRTSPHGYVLALATETLDSLRFAQLADQGRAELESGEVLAAAETLSAALRLWRGPALVDVSPGPSLQAEILRLEEMRKSALERRIEADLQLGRHHELLGELTRLAAQQPTHEGFQARLMLALYRAGRRSEALKVYHRARGVLATELGLDPSSKLQQLHHSVLAADRSLDPPSSRASVRVAKRSRPPRQLPPEGPALVGREPQVASALEALSTSERHAPPIVLVVGPPGSGKSALSTRAAHLASDRYPDGQLYARMLAPDGRPVDPGDVLAEFLRSIGVADEQVPESTGERCRLFRTCTADRRILITLDDAVSMGQLLPLVPSNGGCGLLVTGRRRLAAPAVTATVELRPLSAQEGMRLFSNALGEHVVSQDRQAVRELILLCDGLPAALHTAAARLKVRPHWPLARLARWVSAEIARPGASSNDALKLYTSVERTYRLASPALRTAFRLLSELDVSPLSPAVAACALDTTEAHSECLLDDLVDFQLVQADPGTKPDLPRYRLLPILRAVGRQLPREEEGILPDHVHRRIPAQQDTDNAWNELRVGHEPVS